MLKNISNSRLFKIMALFEGLYFLAPIFALYLTGYGISLATIVISGSVYSLGIVLGEIPTGIFGDKYGQKLSLLIGYAWEVASLLLTYLFPNPASFLLISFVRGFGNTFASGSYEALLYESVKIEEREKGNSDFEKVYTKATAVVQSNMQISFVISTAIAGFAFHVFGKDSFHYLIIGTIVAVIVAVALGTFLKSYKQELQEDKKNGALEEFSGEGASMFTILKKAFSVVKKGHVIQLLLVVSLVTISGEYFVQGVYQKYFLDSNVGPLWIGLVLSIGSLLNAIIVRYIHLFEEKISSRLFITAVIGVLSFLYILLGLTHNPVFLVCVYILAIALFNVHKPFLSRSINEKVPTNVRATVLSGFSFSERIIQTIFLWILGFVIARFGVPVSIISWGIYLLIGSIVSYFLLGSIEKSRKLEEAHS